MKNIFKYIALAGVALAAVACVKAEYKTTNFVSFNSKRVNIPEACGIYKIPVSLYNAKEAVITYKVTEGKAKKGEDYIIVDKDGNVDESGVLSIANGSDTIYVKVTDKTGILTKNLDFSINLLASATEGIVLGSTSALTCTIIDADAGINLLIGSWYGSGDMSLGFDLAVLEESYEYYDLVVKAYPDCNLVISNIDMPEMDITADFDIYGYFDENTGKVAFYEGQPFFYANFGGQIGVCFMGFALKSGKGKVTFSAGDEIMVLDESMTGFLYEFNENWDIGVPVKENGYALTSSYPSGFEMKKTK